MMNLDRFAELLAAYGTNPAQWPQDERAAAEALAQASSTARQLLQEAEALDALLMQRAPMPAFSPDLAARILAQLPPPVIAKAAPAVSWQDFIAALFPFRAAWPQFAAMALALSIGIGLGLGNVEEILAEDSTPYAVQLVIADTSFIPE